jgi:glycosyltransferase involved in cell wall biosynthesis
MKVWYLLMVFPSPSETFVANDVRALRRLGVDVSVHSLRGARRDADRLLRERDLAGVVVTHATPLTILRGLLAAVRRPSRTVRLALWVARHSAGHALHLVRGVALLPQMFVLFERLVRERPDVVHIYWGHYPSIFGWLVRREAPEIVVSLSLSAYDLLRAFAGSASVARRAHVVTTWSAANVDSIAALGVPRESVFVCRQGLDLDHIEGRQLTKIPRRIVTAGRLIPAKGMDDVLRAFARVALEYADARLIVLGEGPDRYRLENMVVRLGIADLVQFRGHVAHREVIDELARAEMFLFLSRYAGERLPNVVKEAMACRCVVVTTATTGLNELMVDGVHGHVVPQGAWELAAQRACAALGSPELSRGMAEEARRHVLERFDVTRLMAGLIDKWREHAALRTPIHERVTSTTPRTVRQHLAPDPGRGSRIVWPLQK